MPSQFPENTPGEVPPFEERLRRAIANPIILTRHEYMNGRDSPPTPLDPRGVFIYDPAKDGRPTVSLDGISEGIIPIPHYAFLDYALNNAAKRAAIVRERPLSQRDEVLAELIFRDEEAQIINRTGHNIAAFEQLKRALAVRPPKDDAMIEIIWRARAGVATLPEAARLIKEYPELDSIETSNCRVQIDNPRRSATALDAIRAAFEMRNELQATFRDAEVIPRNEMSRAPSAIKGLKDIIVEKRVIADIKSIDSYSQLVMKSSLFGLHDHTFCFGVTTYLRDASERPSAIRDFGPNEPSDLDRLLAMDDPDEARQRIGRIASGDI